MAMLTERGLDEGLIEQLRQAGPEAAATVRELVNASDTELEALNDAFENSTRVAVESMQREFDPLGVAESAEDLIDAVALTILENQAMENALIDKVNAGYQAFSTSIDNAGFDDAGYEMTNSAASGILDGTINIENAMRQAASRGMVAMRDELDMHSPSRKAIAIGENYTDSVAMGMYSHADEIEKAQEEISSAMTGEACNKAYSNVIPFPCTNSNGFNNAFSAQDGFNRFDNLNENNESQGYTPAPVSAMQKMEAATSNYQGGNNDFHYHSGDITINGSGLGADEIKVLLSQRDQEGQSDFKEMVLRIMRDEEYKKKRVSNG